MEKDQVDILLAAYNSNEKYLKQQIESILNQTHKNIKLYISDDASTNKTIVKILEEYKSKDNRVKLFINRQNVGFNKNFSYLLEKSTAKYIMFCDHDDIWYKDKVEKSLAKIKKSNASMVYTNARQIDKYGKQIKKNYFKYKNVPLINGKSKLAISRCIGIGCSQMITKEVKEKMLPIKESVIAHDWLSAFIANSSHGITYIYEPLFDYRLHESNVFGGRSLNQNLKRWQQENGVDYKSFKKYRKQVIKSSYLDGAKMCLDYAENEKNRHYIKKLINYYEKILKTKIINLNLIEYFKFLGGKNLTKKMCKEIVLFHFPLLAYVFYNLCQIKE